MLIPPQSAEHPLRQRGCVVLRERSRDKSLIFSSQTDNTIWHLTIWSNSTAHNLRPKTCPCFTNAAMTAVMCNIHGPFLLCLTFIRTELKHGGGGSWGETVRGWLTLPRDWRNYADTAPYWVCVFFYLLYKSCSLNNCIGCLSLSSDMNRVLL